MQFSEDDKKRLFGFYDAAIEAYGPMDARALRWSAREQQLRRFEALCQAGIEGGASVLDVGCGFGDLYRFLAERYHGIQYLGLDINPRMIEIARQKYPDAAFETADFGAWQGESRDFVLASGAFSFKIENYAQIYFGYIKKMYELSRVAAAFNMLDARSHIDDGIFFPYSPKDVYDFCCSITPNARLNDAYLPQDFTVYLYR